MLSVHRKFFLFTIEKPSLIAKKTENLCVNELKKSLTELATGLSYI
jgi:hypothetical protein